MIERLSLFVPGLLAPVRAGESRHPIHAVDNQPVHDLFRYCREQAVTNAEQDCIALTGLPRRNEAAAHAHNLQLPAAAAWLFAAPVLLRPDHAGIYLLGSRPLQLSAIDAAAYCAELNPWLQQDGMQLYPVSPSRWLLALPEMSGLEWTPLADAIGKDLRQIWPQGEAALRWQSRLTEWQMLLNQSKQNQLQQQRGLPPAHALWLWGQEGSVDEVGQPVDTPWFLVSEHSGPNHASSRQPVASLQALLAMTTITAAVVDERLADAFAHGDSVGYQSAYDQFVAELLLPICACLQRGEIAELALYPDDGNVYLIGRRKRWQFWQRTPLPAALRSP